MKMKFAFSICIFYDHPLPLFEVLTILLCLAHVLVSRNRAISRIRIKYEIIMTRVQLEKSNISFIAIFEALFLFKKIKYCFNKICNIKMTCRRCLGRACYTFFRSKKKKETFFRKGEILIYR